MTRTAWRASARSYSPANRAGLYDDITNKIIGKLEAGRLPWVQPWGSPTVNAPLGIPRNAATGRCYSGINVLILWGAVVEHGFSVQRWLTFRQALGLGGNVRRGERGTTVVYADRFVPDDERQRAYDEGEAPRSVPFLKRFTVFNAEQCDGLPDTIAASAPPMPSDFIQPQAEALIRATGADLRIGGDRAYYDVTGDYVRVPPPQAFFEPINWHRTACHELGHWTGAGHRLARDMSGSFGSKTYAQEELIAEICGAYVCAALGIVPTVRHADYIGSWLEVLREDSRAIVRAASAASKAADYLFAFLPGAGGRNTPEQDRQAAGGTTVGEPPARTRRHAEGRESEGGAESHDGSVMPGESLPPWSVADQPETSHDQITTQDYPERFA